MKFQLFAFVAIGVAHAINTGANEPIADNDLGIVAKECALTYCDTKDALALWLVLAPMCRTEYRRKPMEILSPRDCAEYLCPDPDESVVARVEFYIASGC